MANLSTISLPDFTKLADVLWQKGADSIPEVTRRSGLFREIPFPENSGNSREMSEIDMEEYADEKDEGDQADQALVQQGYTKTLTLTRYGKDIDITWEMRNQNKYPEVTTALTGVGKMTRNRLDLDLAHRITYCTATSYTNRKGRSVDVTVGDGLALVSTAHTLRGSATTYRNRLANNPQASKGAIEGMEKLIVENTFNQFGEKMTIPFDIIWSTDDPNTRNTIREHLLSTAEISAPNEGVVNVYRGKYRHVILPRIATDANGAPDSTKAKYWGLASSMDTTAYLGVLEEPNFTAATSGSNAEDVSTEDWTYKTRANYGIAIVGARWFKFSSGDGAA